MRPSMLMLVALLAVAPGSARATVTAPAGVSFTLPAPSFVVDGGTQVTLSGSTRLTLNCDLRNYSTFAPAAGSVVVLEGFGNPLLLGVANFADLTMALHGTASLVGGSKVNGTLTLTSGNLSLSVYDLVANTVSGGSAASYIATPDTSGRLVRSVTSASPVAFPVGHASYDPVTVRTGGPTDDFRVAVMDSPPLGLLTPAAALTRAWALTGRNIYAPGNDGTLSLTVQWNASEQGASFDRTIGNTTSAVAWRWVGGNWSPQPGVRTSDNGAYPAVDNLVTNIDGVWTLAGYGSLLAVEPPEAAPRDLALSSPAPNPFHGATRVGYGLPRRGHVTLALFSLLGERVATLVDGEQEPGWYTVGLEAARLPGGVYFCRLDAGGATQTRKVVLSK